MNKYAIVVLIALSIVLLARCKKDTDTSSSTVTVDKALLAEYFGSQIDLDHMDNYANQGVPAYITKDNSGSNMISDAKATLGRVMFYDKSFSIDNSKSCASCHIQAFAFGDTALASLGVEGGLTGRHSMRLVNARFANEAKFFWDERAATLEIQTTKPMQDHAEMGYSGIGGRDNLDSLLYKIAAIDYYKELFKFAYGDSSVTEYRLQECLAQFVRSIQSFDSKFDIGRSMALNDNQNFSNYTAQENNGKNLYLTAPTFDATGNRISGGLGCNGCHQAPEFDIAPNTGNNGIIGKLNATGLDLTNTRAPSLRDLASPLGEPNTVMMHTGVIPTLQAAIGHYGTITINPMNTNLDPKLMPNGFGQQLHLTATEINSVIAFLKTLTGSNLYTDPKWSDPFL